jgi:hypothetical protein
MIAEKMGRKTEVDKLISRARTLYSELVPGFVGHETSLTLKDFDAIVAIWAR